MESLFHLLDSIYQTFHILILSVRCKIFSSFADGLDFKTIYCLKHCSVSWTCIKLIIYCIYTVYICFYLLVFYFFLQLTFDTHHVPKASTDKCTVFRDKMLLNRRNVTTDVSAKVNGCKKFFQLEIHACVVAAFCEVLGTNSSEEIPKDNPMFVKLTTGTQQEKREFLNKISSHVVDKFIVRKGVREGIYQTVIQRQTYEDWLLSNNLKNSEVYFLCRSKRCPKTFRFYGKRIIEHKTLHGLHKEEEAKSPQAIQDDMFNYQCFLLVIGMLILNFYDAVLEGDGMCVVRCWKYMLPYLKNDGTSSRKYALEALYLLCQIHGILSQRDGHRLIWNRVLTKAKLAMVEIFHKIWHWSITKTCSKMPLRSQDQISQTKKLSLGTAKQSLSIKSCWKTSTGTLKSLGGQENMLQGV